MSKQILFIDSNAGTGTMIFDTFNVFKWMLGIVFIVKNETAHGKPSFHMYLAVPAACTDIIGQEGDRHKGLP